ncbi:MAG: hypothetical protein EP336_16425 [Rhodobacteraceae bacterium]|nr:MAG: hypothetical protein EP336_16425 [Paracoccaceae bacterium]
MPDVDDVDLFGNPLIALPEDWGDGPFVSNLPERDADRPVLANTEELFRRDEPFEENWLTDMPIFGKSDFISMGRLYVSDTIGPQKFRRVAQHFRIEESDALSGTPVIVFQGGSIAIINEGLDALAGQLGPTAAGVIGDLQDRIDAVNMSSTILTQSARASSYIIRIRLPGYEPGWRGTIDVSSIMCFAPGSSASIMQANSIDEFQFGNSASEQRVYKIDYAVGNSIPISIDIINPLNTHRVIVDFTVAVLIDRREQNEEQRQKEAQQAAEARRIANVQRGETRRGHN